MAIIWTILRCCRFLLAEPVGVSARCDGGEFAGEIYAKSNGQAERKVKTVKMLLKESKDPHMSLLMYRSIPFPWCNLSRAEILMGKHMHTNIPAMSDHLTPEWAFLDMFRNKNHGPTEPIL